MCWMLDKLTCPGAATVKLGKRWKAYESVSIYLYNIIYYIYIIIYSFIMFYHVVSSWFEEVV